MRYPFGKGWVYLSVLLAGASIGIALLVLKDFFSLLYYFIFTGNLTAIVLLLKFYLYSREREGDSLEGEEGTGKRRLWSLIVLWGLAFLAMLSLPIFSMVLQPFWWFTLFSGFVAGVNIPEIILYVYSRKSLE